MNREKQTIDTLTVAGMREWFNDLSDSVRLIALVSPT